jgi:hypothetical protein
LCLFLGEPLKNVEDAKLVAMEKKEKYRIEDLHKRMEQEKGRKN